MSFFTELRLGWKKELLVKEIPENFLSMKSNNFINEYIDLYYLKKGKTLLSVLREENNDVLEIIRKINNLGIKDNFENLIINKSTNKLLGYTYPFEVSLDIKEKEFISNITDNDDTYNNICYYLENKNSELKSRLSRILLIYSVLKTLNNNGISVKEIEEKDVNLEDIDGKIYSINSIAKLKLSDENEEEYITKLCIACIKSDSIYERLGYTLKKFFEDFENGTSVNLFEEKLNEQIKNIKIFDCGHEWDKLFIRCPFCNGKDVIFTHEEIEELKFVGKRVYLRDKKFTLYNREVIDSDYDFLIFTSSVLEEEKEVILKTLELKTNEDYGIIYSENGTVIGLRMLFSGDSFNNYQNAKTYLDNLTVNKNISGNMDIILFMHVFIAIKKEIDTFYDNNYIIACDDDELLDQFIVNNNNNTQKTIFVKLTSIVENTSRKLLSSTESTIKILFNYLMRRKKGAEIIELIDPIIYIQYMKFIENKPYDYYLAYNKLCNIGSNLAMLGYSRLYKVNPLYIKSKFVLNGVYDDTLEGDELNTSDINDKIGNVINKKYDIIMPKNIIYGVENNSINYIGYVIEKKEGVLILDIFDCIEKNSYDNKNYLRMLISYVKNIDKFSEYPVKYAYFNKDFTEVFFRYNNKYDDIDFSFNSYFITLIAKLEASNVYLSDALEIIKTNNKPERNLLILFSSFTNYCSNHNTWYEKNLKKCPICSKYNLYIDLKDFENKSIVYENDLCKMISYKKTRNIKLFKEINGKLSNGKEISRIEEEVLNILKSNNKTDYLKIVKDDKTEKTIGILMTRVNLKSLKEVLDKSNNTNKAYLNLCISLLKSYKKNPNVFNEILNYNIEEIIRNRLFYNSKEISVLDIELCNYHDNNVYDISQLSILDKIIKYILFYDKKCIEFESIEFPPIDSHYIENIGKIISDLKDYLCVLCDKHNIL